MLSIDAILFDLDGTLVDSKKDIASSVHYLQKKYKRPPSSEEDIARFIGDGVVKLVERAIGRKKPLELEEAVALFKTHYRLHALDTTYVYPGVHYTLSHFREKKMAVVTNKPVRVSKHILQGLGLAPYFPVVLGGDSFTRKKPHPEGVFQALDQLGMRRTRSVLMVGDSAQDVIAGRAAGTRTCGIISNIGDRRFLQRSAPDYTISSLYDLTRIIS